MHQKTRKLQFGEENLTNRERETVAQAKTKKTDMKNHTSLNSFHKTDVFSLRGKYTYSKEKVNSSLFMPGYIQSCVHYPLTTII